MRKLIPFLALLAFAGIARGATYTAASASYADVNACVNSGAAATCSPGGTHTVVNGDIVKVPCGSATWSSALVGPTGVWFTLQFGSGCATPNSGSSTSVPSSACEIGSIITDNVTGVPMMSFTPTYASGSLMRISCLDIEPTAQVLANPIQIYATIIGATAGQAGFRIDNIIFGKTTAWSESVNGSGSAEVIHLNDVFGVMDHDTNNSGGNIALYVDANESYLGIGDNGDNSWAQPSSFGTANNVFAENNTWYTAEFALNDCEAPLPWGCRVVNRYNTIFATANNVFGITLSHGTDTTGRGRSGFSQETYYNSITCPLVCTSVDGGLRGGSAIMFGNHANLTAGEGASQWFGVSLYRTVINNNTFGPCGGLNSLDPYDQNNNTVFYSGVVTTASGLSMTDTSKTWTAGQFVPTGAPYSFYDTTNDFVAEIVSNTTDGLTVANPAPESNYTALIAGDNYEIIRSTICIDQPGRGQGTYLSGVTPTPTGYPTQALSPMYQLGDTYSGSANVNEPLSVDSGKILANRDYFAQTTAQVPQTSSSSPFNGSSGVGWGPLSLRPASCAANSVSGATGVAYGETTGGIITQIDFCIATNTWSTTSTSPASYVPYTYPHPYDSGTTQASPPTASPTSGVVPQTVTVTNPNSGTTVVCYAASPTIPATNGLGTGCTTGTQYSSPITVSSAETLNLVAGVASETDSTVASYMYSAAAVPPTVTTTTATGITTTTATTGGTVTATGGASVTAEGVACGTSPNPTAGTGCSVASGGTSTPFTINLTGLTASTLYYIRGYATNSAGTGYGSDLSFTTLTANCASPTTINGGYTACGFGYNDAATGTSVTVAASPFAGNPVLLAPQVCGTGCTTVPPTVTVILSDNINNPEMCFHATPHSPFAMAMPTVPDYETFWGYFAPDGCLPSGITSFTATFSATVAAPQMDELEIKAGQIATSGYFESVDNLQTSGGVAGLSGTVSTSATTVNANDLLIAVMANCGATNPAIPGTGYTGLNVNPTTSFGTVNGHVLEAMGVTTTGVKSAGFSWSSGTAPTYCQAGGGGSNTVSFGMIIPLVSVNGSVLLSPATNNFGSVNVGSSSASQTFTITNNNATTATAISASTGSALFPVTNTGAGSCSAAGGSLAEGASCTVTVKFSPSASGLVTGTLTVSYSGGDGASPITSALSGTGVNSPAATPTCSPAGGTFTSTSGPIVCTETGGAPLTCFNATGYIAINGAMSCPAGSTHYTGAFVINSSQKLYIWAGGSGFADSPESTYTFTINLPSPPAPTIKILVQNTQTEKVPITNSLTLNGETATLGPQTHTLTISTSCTCTVATATGVVSGCVCPQTVSVTN